MPVASAVTLKADNRVAAITDAVGPSKGPCATIQIRLEYVFYLLSGIAQ
jgi:hypothetical protein